MTWSRRARTFWPLLAALLLADCTTKELAESYLAPDHVPHDVVGSVVRLTLAHNPDAGMGLSLGGYSRVGFSVAAFAALVLLGGLYRSSSPTGYLRPAALGLVMGGALGNLGSRLMSPTGVTDFIDIGVGDVRFYTFNVADVGVSCGVILLLLAFRAERRSSESG